MTETFNIKVEYPKLLKQLFSRKIDFYIETSEDFVNPNFKNNECWDNLATFAKLAVQLQLIAKLRESCAIMYEDFKAPIVVINTHCTSIGPRQNTQTDFRDHDHKCKTSLSMIRAHLLFMRAAVLHAEVIRDSDFKLHIEAIDSAVVMINEILDSSNRIGYKYNYVNISLSAGPDNCIRLNIDL